eukprot:NODE_181_length_13917_cov_0.838110.p13 type:complete len:109 gc:universal NODE_181_length_13917_cov_0.838110:10778-11104(+)
MLHRVMETLIERFAEAQENQINSVTNWSLGGLLQVLMEIEFLTLVLEHYLSDRASRLFHELYQQIKAKTVAIQSGIDSTSLQKGLEVVKSTIKNTHETTSVQFICFKQ